MLICEDFWHASPPYLLWLDGADLLLFSSASPGRGLNVHDKLETAWWWRVSHKPMPTCLPICCHSNRVGYEDGFNFWGGVTVFDPNGERIAYGPYYEEALTMAPWI